MSITAADLLVSARADITGALKGLSDLEAAVTKSEKTLGDKGQVIGKAVGDGMTKGLSGEEGRVRTILKDMAGLGDYNADMSFSQKGEVIGGALGRGVSKGLAIGLGDVGALVDTATNIFAAGIAAIPQVGLGMSAAFKEMSGALTDATARGFLYNDNLRKQQIQLGLVSESADEAKQKLKALGDITNSTGINRGFLVDSLQTLEMFGIKTERAENLIRGLSKHAASLGREDISGETSLIARMMETGKVDGRMIKAFANQKIDLNAAVSSELGISRQDAHDALMKGVLSPKNLTAILTDYLNSPKFTQAADAMTHTTQTGQANQYARGVNRVLGSATEGAYNASIAGYQAANAAVRSPSAGSMAANVETALSPVTGAMERAFTAMQSGDIFGGAVKSGESIIEGLTKGITGKLGNALSAARDLGLGSIESLAASIGAHSPATKFIELGEFAGEGFEIGIMNSTKRAFINWRKFTAEQLEVARKIIEVGQGMGASDKQIKAAVSTGIVESKLTNLGDLGKRNDHQSHGVFQQQPFAEWGTLNQTMDVAHAATRFFEHAARMDKEGLSAGELAARVQRPRKDLRGLYGEAMGDAEKVIARLVGGGNALPVRIVEAVVGAGFTRAKQREDYSPISNPATKAIGDMYDASGKLIGIWHDVEQTIHDTGQMVINVKGGFTELVTEGKMLGAEFLNLKPHILEVETAVENTDKKLYTAAEKGKGQIKGLGAELREMGLTSESVGKMFESSFMDAVGHANEGIKGMARTLVVDMVKSILQVEEKWLAAKFASALFGSGKKGSSDNSKEGGGSGGGGLLSGLLSSIFGGLFGGKGGGKHAAGGYISGEGSGTSDSIPSMLSNGEYVMKADAVSSYGRENLDAINSGRGAKQETHHHYHTYTINVPLPAGQPITPQTRRQIADAAHSGLARINRTK